MHDRNPTINLNISKLGDIERKGSYAYYFRVGRILCLWGGLRWTEDSGSIVGWIFTSIMCPPSKEIGKFLRCLAFYLYIVLGVRWGHLHVLSPGLGEPAPTLVPSPSWMRSLSGKIKPKKCWILTQKPWFSLSMGYFIIFRSNLSMKESCLFVGLAYQEGKNIIVLRLIIE
jgi:hypothetical protein